METAETAGFDALVDLVGDGGVVILSGAGISTDSGIPDYRGPSGAALRRHAPMTYQTFMGDAAARHRYWARSYLGWRHMTGARPNSGHRAVASLQRQGLLEGVITQNVDGLHQAAGATGVIELHGGLDRALCLNCGAAISRADLDRDLHAVNPDFTAHAEQVNPDGDAELPEEELDAFTMVPCEVCGDGPLKPDVVFFGETVPRPRVDTCFELVNRAGSLLILGSSLKVMSGFRFVLHARKLGIPVAIVNQGETRGDTHCNIRVDAPLGVVLPALADSLTAKCVIN
ncbi:NAD-dependent protein deacetylase [Kineosporia succinea]|uniref:NAD-dependent protein deacetylase n=1 Tax=Kineosporia succinea TaxID=84632 RepID=A0ABT9P911_9ACTN|nr:NAD-dependent protein deacetylase [Kineosporia succinea]MDP9828515.1 NAD-dependent SIR2 family protein deacetylase [Kineosporia succinea]